MRASFQCLGLALAAACASYQSPPPESSAQPATPPPEVIYRNTSWEDPELAAKGLGRLEVVVRVADRPAQVVQSANVSIRLVGATGPSRQLYTDQRGVAAFEAGAVGRYDLIVRAIGYGVAQTQVSVSPGCRSDVEVYIGIFAVGIAPPPPEPSRIRVTTCRTPR